LDDAQSEVEQAVAMAPDDAYAHYCRSVVLEHRRHFVEAEAAVRESLRLDSADPDFYAQLAVVLFHERKWQAALDASVEGLKFDSEHSGCTNLRSMALSQLGRQDEAIAAVDSALARDPDNEFAHANKGWALLHERKPKLALEHFREALRLDPNYESAQLGIVEALKAHNVVYRWMLTYFLWMSRLDNRTRWIVILGGYFGAKFLRNVARNTPSLELWIMPILVVYFIFVWLTWFAIPLFNLLLRFNKYGRHALSREQRISSNWFAGCCLVFALGAIWTLGTNSATGALVAIYGVGMAMPLVTLYALSPGWPRKWMSLLALAMAIVGASAIVASAVDSDIVQTLGMAFLFGFIATPWVANALANVTVRR
jgi:tetratricopeptide (TPR) repeat protein